MKVSSSDTLLVLTLMVSMSGLIGCSGSNNQESPEYGLFTENEIVVDGLRRTYDYYVPEELGTSPVPLVFLLHGGGSESADLTGENGFQAPYKEWLRIADEEKFIVLFPNGETSPLGGQGWNDCRADATTNPTVDDVHFFDTLLEQFSGRYSIDSDRIYVSGTSNGGHMSIRLALERSRVVAAIAPIVAAMPEVPCSEPDEPISILFILGTEDPLSPYEGGEVSPVTGGRGTVLSAQESVNLWTLFNQTDSTPMVVELPDINMMDNSTVTQYTYSNGLQGTEVVLLEVDGGGHVEPSINQQYSIALELLLGAQNHDFEMARVVWSFFANKRL